MSSPSPANLPGAALAHTQSCPVSDEAARLQLGKILESSAFRSSESLKRFLRYAVEHTLHGEGGQLKEYRLGVEVFDRASTFDPRLDPVVRMAARRLRTKLREYYDSEGKRDLIRIDIPKGCYAAAFAVNGSWNLPASQSSPVSSKRLSVRNRIWGISFSWFWAGAGILVAAMAVLLVLGRGGFLPLRSNPALGETDALLISDVVNATGDSVFDDTLKQAISVELGQSPFLNIVSDASIRATLKLMSMPADTRITPDIAREICQRTGGRTYIAGSIRSLGRQYVIGLNAVNCQSGDILGQVQATAESKERVLKALDEASRKLRKRLGESLSTIRRFDTPLEQATTPSLEALKAYSLGNIARDRKGDAAALSFFHRATELDPDFALAYDALGISYSNLDEPGLASKNIAKAYEMRDHASEREKFEIAADYSQLVTGELGKVNEICELWAQAYPRDEYPHDLLGVNYEFVGQYEKAVAEMSRAVRLNPDGAVLRSNLMEEYLALNRLSDAKTAYQLALARNLNHPYLHAEMYALAFLERDNAEMDRQLSWAGGQPGAEDLLLSLESDSSAFFGMLGEARKYSRGAIESAKHNGQKETAALWQMNAALREAEFGNLARARRDTAAALSLAPTRDVQILAALTLARAGDSSGAQTIAHELVRRFPLNTVINGYWLPTIRAAMEIGRGRPAKAIDILDRASPFELGYPDPQIEVGRLLYPIYVRGQAYLLLHRGNAALIEFRKMVENRGLIVNSPQGALAHFGLARAYALSGDKLKSRAAYQQFFSLWKDADAEIPILKRAKAEYAKVQ